MGTIAESDSKSGKLVQVAAYLEEKGRGGAASISVSLEKARTAKST